MRDREETWEEYYDRNGFTERDVFFNTKSAEVMYFLAILWQLYLTEETLWFVHGGDYMLDRDVNHAITYVVSLWMEEVYG